MKFSTKLITSAALISGLFAGVSNKALADATYWANDFTHTSGVGGGGFNFNNGPVIGVWDNFSDFGDLIFKADFNNVTFDNTASMTSSYIQPWGNNGSTATYGQTFIAAEGTTTLNDFTFYINDLGGGANFTYQAFVMTWNGSLTGGSQRDESASSIIYASNPISYVGDGTFQAITSLIPNGGLSLTAGNAYLIGLTTLGSDVIVPTPPVQNNVPDQANSALIVMLGLGMITAVRRQFVR